jgi:hypothetical protein
MARILYVEDNDDNIYMLQRRLQKHGFEVVSTRVASQPSRIGRPRSIRIRSGRHWRASSTPAAPTGRRSPPRRREGGAAMARILYVEDNDDNIYMLQRLPAVEDRQAEIHQDQVRPALARKLDAGGAVAGDHDLEP